MYALSVTVADSLQGKYHNSNWNKRTGSCTRGLHGNESNDLHQGEVPACCVLCGFISCAYLFMTREKFLHAAHFVVSFPVLIYSWLLHVNLCGVLSRLISIPSSTLDVIRNTVSYPVMHVRKLIRPIATVG